MSERRALLELVDVDSGYGHVEVVRDVSIFVEPGELVAIIGSNGAGKSTLLKTIAGLLAPSDGSVIFGGQPVTGMAPERLVKRGMALVPEGRLLFGPMTVRENLELGAYSLPRSGKRQVVEEQVRAVGELFPVLAERADQPAETLSGGEQQMLAIGRAMMSRPKLLLLDEPSLGLAPKVIAEIFEALDSLRDGGVTLLLVEQDARLALQHASRGYVMQTGRVVLEGASERLLADEDVRNIYLGSWKGEGEPS